MLSFTRPAHRDTILQRVHVCMISNLLLFVTPLAIRLWEGDDAAFQRQEELSLVDLKSPSNLESNEAELQGSPSLHGSDSAPVIRWEWQNDGGLWEPYKDEDAIMLDETYNILGAQGTFQTRKFSFNNEYGTTYEVNFENMQQKNMETQQVRLLRRGPEKVDCEDVQQKNMKQQKARLVRRFPEKVIQWAYYSGKENGWMTLTDEDGALLSKAMALGVDSFFTRALSVNEESDNLCRVDFETMTLLSVETGASMKIQTFDPVDRSNRVYYEKLLTRTRNLPYTMKTTNNALKETDDDQLMGEVVANALGTQPIIHKRVYSLFERFLKSKQDVAFYNGMGVLDLVERLLTKRLRDMLSRTLSDSLFPTRASTLLQVSHEQYRCAVRVQSCSPFLMGLHR
eukprot:TRINITY_DN2678_c0_g2_i1.p1 TRINITY_DN2678_c0_g2~~TRINITY_DN2678_c0_g2_i1.p1  ORF type:complete len:398 (+),score=40.97 TRINITY_DN2678_c0_g2_i1:22-1215(+)